MLQKELIKRLKGKYETKMDDKGWLNVFSDGIPLCRVKYNGNQYAEYLLGKTFLKGEDIERDTERAESLLSRSSEQGNKYAAYTLGKAYLDGDVLAQSIDEAVRLLNLSASKGFAPAQFILGRLLYKGEVVPKDIKKCKHFLGYNKNADGEIEIVPEEAEIIREIYERYLSGESLHGIKCYLEEKEIPTPAGCSVWRQETIRSILSNEKYKGDAIINKTYVSDCISKRIKANNGERNKYYIENNHPAIIDAGTFARAQEEIARRSGKPKVKQKGTKTELSRYSSRYALSELLICGECRTPYRRCTWTAKGKRKIVWRCINRLDYGKKYCHHSPSIEESLLQDAVMRAIMQTAKQNVEVLKTLKIHIGMGLTDEVTEDKTLDIQIRIAEINTEFQKLLKAVSADNADGIDEERITELMNEKQRLTVQLEQYAAMRQKRESAKSRLDEIYTILDGLQNHPMEYNDKLVRQIIECIVVESKEKIKVVFIGGTEIEMTL